MYDSVGLVKAFFAALGRKKCVEKRRRGEDGVKGAFFAFISTLDTVLPTSTIGLGLNLRFFLRFNPSLKKRPAFAKPPKLTLCVESFFDGSPIGSISHVFGPVPHHDYLFKLSPASREAGRPINLSALRPRRYTDWPACEPRSITLL